MRTETELILKSRKVVPLRLREASFPFQYETAEQALANLVPTLFPKAKNEAQPTVG